MADFDSMLLSALPAVWIEMCLVQFLKGRRCTRARNIPHSGGSSLGIRPGNFFVPALKVSVTAELRTASSHQFHNTLSMSS
jgi:hypothetical protein